MTLEPDDAAARANGEGWPVEPPLEPSEEGREDIGELLGRERAESAELTPRVDAEIVPAARARPAQHAAGTVEVPEGYDLYEGVPNGTPRGVAVVVARYNGEITGRLLAGALGELEASDVPRESVTVTLVPGAFELPLVAMALAKTRRYACVVALGCIVQGETPHFDFVAAEAASGLQLAALETGVPVSFGVLTLESADQAEARIGKGAEAVQSALEMADLFGQLRRTTSLDAAESR